MRRELAIRGVDAAIAALAGRQHGVVARRQLLALGLGPEAIVRRLAAGRLHEVHRGVYAVGHTALTTRARWMAAVLAAGPGAVLSHRAAAALWGIRGGSLAEVTGPRAPRRPGIVGHHGTVPPDERTIHDGIPTTTVARTLLDLAAVVPERQLARAIHEADYLRLTDTVPLDALVARYPRRRGITAIKKRRITAPRLLRHELEHRFLEFVRGHGLPLPASNVTVLGFECDAVWWDERLIVELDGGAHDLPERREADRARDRALTVAGWRVVRITWRQLHDDPGGVARDLRALLRRA